MIKTILKLIKSYWEWDIKPFFKAFFPENKVEIRDEEEPLGYIEDHINEEWDVERPTCLNPRSYKKKKDSSKCGY